MPTRKIKFVVQGRRWFDKVNGNSYFSGEVTLNYGTKYVKSYKMPFKYGYGSHYIDMAGELLRKEVLKIEKPKQGYFILW